MHKVSIKCNSVLNDNDNSSDLYLLRKYVNYAPEGIKNYPSKLQPRLQPGVYMILCLGNDYRYYGETSNISLRLAGHKRDLRQKIHRNSRLQDDWNLLGEEYFEFSVLFIGQEWAEKNKRLETEAKLIKGHVDLCYNFFATMNDRTEELNAFYGKKHTEKTKKLIGDLQRGIPKDALGTPVHINGIVYPSLAEASRHLGHSRKYIRIRLDSPQHPSWYRLSEKPNDYPNGSRGNAGPETASSQ